MSLPLSSLSKDGHGFGCVILHALVVEAPPATSLDAISLHRQSLLYFAFGALVSIIRTVHTAAQQPRDHGSSSRTAALLEFHSNFWVNLHQLLFHEALVRIGKPDRCLQSNVPLDVPQMSQQEKAEWDAAIAFYTVRFGSHEELFDAEMVQINDRLATQPDDGTTPDLAGLPPEVISKIQSVARIYRKYWCPSTPNQMQTGFRQRCLE